MNLTPQINNAPLTTIDDRLINLMKEELNTEEQQQCVNSFKLYLKYGYDDNKFIINFDDIWKWVGFMRKDPAKRLLISKFTENINFIYQKDVHFKVEMLLERDKIKNKNANINNEVILLNVSTFKKFCIKASTQRADEICDYYIKMEKIMFKYTEEKLIENQIKLQETQNNLLETQKKLSNFIEYDEELFWNENQISDYNNKNVIYIAFIGIINNERIYKYGKSEQIYTREFKQHQKFFSIFKMKYVIESDNMSYIEKEFKKNLKSKNLLRTIEINYTNQTELFTISEQQNIDLIIENLVKLVDENPLPAIKNLRKELEETKDRYIKELEKKDTIIKQKDKDLEEKETIIKQKDVEIEELKQEYNKVHLSYQKLRLNVNNNIINKSKEDKTEAKNEIIDNEVEENNVVIIEKSENVRHQGPFVQVYDSEDIKKLIFVYPSITEATRRIEGSSYTAIKFASTNKIVYLNYRWLLVDRTNKEPFKARDIGKTVENKVKKVGIIAMLNKEKTKVEKVFENQTKAGEYCNQCKSAICNAVKYNACLNGHYWYLWNDISVELQNEFLINNTLPEIEKKCPKSVKIERIDPITNEVLEILNSITDVCKKYKISPKTLKKYLISGEVYNNFRWKNLS